MLCEDCGRETNSGESRCETCAAEEVLREESKLEAKAAQRRYDNSVTGVGGLLAFFCLQIALLAIGLFWTLIEETISEWRAHPGNWFEPLWWFLPLIAWFGATALVLWALITRRRWAPRVTRFYLLGVPLFGWLLAFVVQRYAPEIARTSEWTDEMIPQLSGFTLSCALWFSYFCLSRRVKATYSPTVLGALSADRVR